MSKQILSWNASPITYNTFPLQYEIDQSFMSFYTDASTTSFTPTFTPNAGILQWDLGDGSIISTNGNIITRNI